MNPFLREELANILEEEAAPRGTHININPIDLTDRTLSDIHAVADLMQIAGQTTMNLQRATLARLGSLLERQVDDLRNSVKDERAARHKEPT